MKVSGKWHQFAAAHRLAWHPKCQRIHGHNFRVRVSVEGSVDEEKGILFDFGELSKSVEEVIAPLDHRFLAPDEEGTRHYDAVDGKEAYYEVEWGRYRFPEEDVVVMPMKNVSTENLAKWILGELEKKEWAQGKMLTVQVDESGDNGVEVKSVWASPLLWNTTTFVPPGSFNVAEWKSEL
jgi:6-pyruvoyltetrahydropterin/6-carboxytetrahydropterin synthase